MNKITKAINKMKEEGYKHTDKREEMLRFIAENNRYLSAKEVLEHMKQDYPGLSFDTIYRNLYLFEQLGILETTEMNGEKYFRFQCETDSHHHHFICLECGKTKHIHTCPMEHLEKDLSNFEVTGHKFEIYGKCPDCV